MWFPPFLPISLYILFIYWFNKYLSNITYVSEAFLDAENISVNDQKMSLFSWPLYFCGWVGRE